MLIFFASAVVVAESKVGHPFWSFQNNFNLGYLSQNPTKRTFSLETPYDFVIMPETNPNAPPRPDSLLNPSDALKHLEEYPRGDGLSLQELMDSRKNGGLTYNDFLVLPGHINFPASDVSLQSKWVFLRGRNNSDFVLMTVDTQSYQEHRSQHPLPLFSYGHRY